MGQTKEQIEREIERARGNLGSNLDALENKVKAVADWKEQFREHPTAMMGIAFGGGVLLAALVGGKRSAPGPRRASAAGGVANDVWDNVKSALIGVAATRIKTLVSEAVPGFREEWDRTQDKARPMAPHVAA
jgi:hypothetical protein